MIGTDIARALDPALIAADCGLHLDRWQADLMRSTALRILLNCSRQSGKSTVSALIAIATAITKAGALVLLVSPSQRQSGELFRTVMKYLAELDGAPKASMVSALRAELSNRSRIIALPGSEQTVRGYSAADLIVIDEASRVPDELITAVRPMLAISNGRLIALSTPAGTRGWWHSAWIGDESWHRVRVAAKDCPRISAAFLKEELRELGQQRFSEEYELAFLDPDESVFPTHIIDAAFTDAVRPLW